MKLTLSPKEIISSAIIMLSICKMWMIYKAKVYINIIFED